MPDIHWTIHSFSSKLPATTSSSECCLAGTECRAACYAKLVRSDSSLSLRNQLQLFIEVNRHDVAGKKTSSSKFVALFVLRIVQQTLCSSGCDLEKTPAPHLTASLTCPPSVAHSLLPDAISFESSQNP